MSVTTYYEAHITMMGIAAYIKPAVEKLRWKFSVIEGDTNLGAGSKCYATKQFKASEEKEQVLQQLLDTANKLEGPFAEVLRRKIELVLYDDRSSTVRFTCDGLCPECQ